MSAERGAWDDPAVRQAVRETIAAERGPSGTGHERPPVAVPGPAPVPHPDEDRHGPHPSTEGAADPVVSPADAIRRGIHDPSRFQSGAECQAALDALDVLLAVGERDKAEIKPLRKALADAGLPATASVDDLIQHHRNNAALAAAFDKVTERERDRQQIARLTEALRFYADKSKWNYRIGGKQPRATYVSYRLAEEALRDVAVLADEEDARG